MAEARLIITWQLSTFRSILGAFLISTLAACAQTSVARFDGGAVYSPTSRVDILAEPPNRQYETLAILETKGAPNMSLPDLINDMQQEAMSIGADAIVFLGRSDQQTPQQLMFNPLLGGYQTLGGNQITTITAIAIKYK